MPAPIRDFSRPYLEQAREDLRAARLLYGANCCPSTLCMLLQMVFEKLAKADYCQYAPKLPTTHQAASRLFASRSRDSAGNRLLQPSRNVRQFIVELENAHPSLAGKQTPTWAQLEYPWEDTASGGVLYPARDLYLARRVGNPKDRIAADCLKFATALEKQLTTIVP